MTYHFVYPLVQYHVAMHIYKILMLQGNGVTIDINVSGSHLKDIHVSDLYQCQYPIPISATVKQDHQMHVLMFVYLLHLIPSSRKGKVVSCEHYFQYYGRIHVHKVPKCENKSFVKLQENMTGRVH